MSAVSDLGDAIASTTEALRLCCNDPADAVRLLSRLAGFSAAAASSAAPIAVAEAAARQAVAAMCRRAAMVSLVKACADYLPGSYDEAASLRQSVATLFDDELARASEEAGGDSYRALRQLRADFVADMNERGAQLARLRTVTTAVPTPSLVLAYRLYGDATRADELTARADPPHPGALPLSFQALSY